MSPKHHFLKIIKIFVCTWYMSMCECLHGCVCTCVYRFQGLKSTSYGVCVYMCVHVYTCIYRCEGQKRISYTVCVCMYMYVQVPRSEENIICCVCVCTCVYRCQGWKKISAALDLDLQAVMISLIRVLRTKVWSSERSARALAYWAPLRATGCVTLNNFTFGNSCQKSEACFKAEALEKKANRQPQPT